MRFVAGIATLVLVVITSSCHADSTWDDGLFDGDIRLDPDQWKEVLSGRFGYGARNDKDMLWPGAVVPYKIHANLAGYPDAVKAINEAIADYHVYTCIRYKPHTTEENYILFSKGGGCSSSLGYRDYRGAHRIYLAPRCWWKGNVIHEMAHNLGFYHEMSRPDRDQFVSLLWKNMSNPKSSNFKIASGADTLGTPYDYLSLLHYPWNAGSKLTELMTIRTHDPKYQYAIGQREGFSKWDVVDVNRLYKCKGVYPTPPPYVHPSNLGCKDEAVDCSKIKHVDKRCDDEIIKLICTRTCKTCSKGFLRTLP